jgi:hypothetical protein
VINQIRRFGKALRSRIGRRRTVLASLALLFLTLVAGTLWFVFRPASPSKSSADWRVFHDDFFGWEVRYPPGMRVGHFESNGLFQSDGAWIGTFQANTSASHPDLLHLRGDFPDEAVLFQLWWGERFRSSYTQADQQFPLSIDDLHQIRPYVGGKEPPPLYLNFWRGGTPFSLAVWIGPRASLEERTAIERMVAAIKFPVSNEYRLRFAARAAPPTSGDRNGGASVAIRTNLPDGTMVLVAYDTGGASGFSCCPIIDQGKLTVDVDNLRCLDPGFQQSDGFVITLAVAPTVTTGTILQVTGSLPDCPGGCRARPQQASILEVLGEHFEKAAGDQMTTIGHDRIFIATSPKYAWPARTCGLVP